MRMSLIRPRTSLFPSVASCLVKLFHWVAIWPPNPTPTPNTIRPHVIARTMRALWRRVVDIDMLASRASSSSRATRASAVAAHATRMDMVRWRPCTTAAGVVLAFEISFAW